MRLFRHLLLLLGLLFVASTGAQAQTDLETPLTLEAKTAGTIVVSNPKAGMQYKKNDEAKTDVTCDEGKTFATINVVERDKVQFFGNGTEITSYDDTHITGGDADCYIYGNIMSLVDETGFATATELTGDNTFTSLFDGNGQLYNHTTKKLVLPATTLADKCYQSMFCDCPNLTTAPELPATTLAQSCYEAMFSGCENLSTVPALPATTLTEYCYEYMFAGCENLTTAPALPATTLTKYCYNSMFENCKRLTAAPALPATTLADNCYEYMFNGCESLTTAPALPATTLEKSCYSCMFNGCENLTTAPELPATTLADNCYWAMFQDCTNLTTAPELPATTLAEKCYQSMFYGCTGLTTAPELPATTLAEGCYNHMFIGCTNLNSVTCLATDISASGATTNWLNNVAATGTFTKAAGASWTTDSPSGIPTGWTELDYNIVTPLTLEAKTAGTIVVSDPQSGMQYRLNDGSKTPVPSTEIQVNAGDKVQFFGNNTSIKSYIGTEISGNGTADCYIYGNIMSLVDEDGFATATELTENNTFEELFSGNQHLYNHDTKKLVLPATTLTYQCYRYMFDNTNLTVAPELPATTLADECYYGMFWGCRDLSAAPELPATTLAYDCYGEMFQECTNLTTAPELPATTLADNCYEMMFYDCTSLTTAPELPAKTLAEYCYWAMFEGCTSLTTAPELPATTLAMGCYNKMFSGCENLNSVTCLATDISASYATTDWLKNVAATGTFTKAAGASWTIDSPSGIPNGWTVNDVQLVMVTITAAGMATFCFDKALTIPAGVEVWYCRSINEDTGIVFAFPIQSGVIPANTGVFLTGEAGSYPFTVTDATVSAITDNIMVGTTEEITVTPRQVLTLGHDRNGRLGFNYFNGTTIPANKAYIPADRISVSASAISFFPVTPVEDEATGIAKPVEVIKMEDDTIYDLAGRKVKTVTKGIFIKNGKKFIVK